MSASNIPIGTILPFAGMLASTHDQEWLRAQGWLLCDGRSLVKGEYSNLVAIIGTVYGGSFETFNLPDLRGRFPRATTYDSEIDPDADSRELSNPGGAAGNAVGSLQSSATATPKQAFTSNTGGSHSHSVSHAPIGNNAYAIAGGHYGIWTTDSSNTSDSGAHTHALTTGWDQESRPRNLYVNYIIKFTNTL